MKWYVALTLCLAYSLVIAQHADFSARKTERPRGDSEAFVDVIQLPLKFDEKIESSIAKDFSGLATFDKIKDDPKYFQSIQDAGMRVLRDAFDKTFADCDGYSVKFSPGKGVLGTPLIEINREKRGITEPGEERERPVETISFRPVKVTSDQVILEIPTTPAQRRLKPDLRSFFVIKVGNRDSRDVLSVRKVHVDGKKSVLEPAEHLEDSSIQRCRTEHDPKSKLNLLPEAKRKSFTIGNTEYSVFHEKDPSFRKAFELWEDSLRRGIRTLPKRYYEADAEFRALEEKRKTLRDKIRSESERVQAAASAHDRLKSESAPRLKSLEQNERDARTRIAGFESSIKSETSSAAAGKKEWDKMIAGVRAYEGKNSDDELDRDLETISTYFFQAGAKKEARERFLSRQEYRKKVAAQWESESAIAALVSKKRIDNYEDELVGAKAWLNVTLDERTQLEKAIGAARTNAERLKKLAGATEKELADTDEPFKALEGKAAQYALATIPSDLRNQELVPMLMPLDRASRLGMDIVRKIVGGSEKDIQNAAVLSLRDPKTLEEKGKAVILIQSDAKGAKLIVANQSKDISTEQIMKTKVFPEPLARGGGELMAAGDFMGPIPQALHELSSLKREAMPLSRSRVFPEYVKLLNREGVMPKDLSDLEAQIQYSPSLAAKLGAGTAAVHLPNAEAHKLVTADIPKSLKERLTDRELGKNKIFSLYPLEVLEKEFPEVLIHEAAHALDFNTFHWSPTKPQAPSANWNRSTFDKAFPKILESERRGKEYLREKEKFFADHEEERKFSALPKKTQDEKLTKAFEAQFFGENAEELKKKVKSVFEYQHRPAEMIAFSLQVSYLRDEKGMTLEQVLDQMRRLAGGTKESRISEYERAFFAGLYGKRFADVLEEVKRPKR